MYQMENLAAAMKIHDVSVSLNNVGLSLERLVRHNADHVTTLLSAEA